ncbi:uncharacterized protein VP01_3461g2 [Puccinia sorghi]|uniref:Uncharacterized protein n=1 Tax=Puccinia sorghi TaxID=27349 RepID=A0A0L6UWX7_9BASI|nr:uncharacterized protein VP01_3461g2 [Puccinia sorghi]
MDSPDFITPTPSHQQVLDHCISHNQSAENLPRNDTLSPNLAPCPKPGWGIVLAPNKAVKDISSAIDESNILHTKHWANLAMALLCSDVPRTHRKAILSSDLLAWRGNRQLHY